MPFKLIRCFSILVIFLSACDDSRLSDKSREQAPQDGTASVGGQQQQAERVLIATIDGSDNSTRYAVLLTLNEAGINCDISGSVGYGIFVKSSEAHRAIERLRDAPEISQNAILAGNNYPTLGKQEKETIVKQRVLRRECFPAATANTTMTLL